MFKKVDEYKTKSKKRKGKFRFLKLSKEKLRKMPPERLVSRMSILEDYRYDLESRIRQGDITGEKQVKQARKKIEILKNEYKKTDEILQEKG